MHAKRLLVVDADVRNLRVLERKLSGAGYEVECATRIDDAFDRARDARFDVLITEQSPDLDGLSLCKDLKRLEKHSRIGVICLSRDPSVDTKQLAMEAGADEYLQKPIFVREILLRLSSLLAQMERRDMPSSFSGALSRLGVVDLLQLMEASRKTCVVNVRTDVERSGGFATGDAAGAIFFQAGQVIGATLGQLNGPSAIYRMLLWKDGAFAIEFTEVDQPQTIQEPTQGLLLEGMRRIDEWTRALEVIGPPTVRLRLSATAMNDLGSAPDALMSVLPHLDGKRPLLDALDMSGLEDETVALAGIVRLMHEGSLRDVDLQTGPIPLTQVKTQSIDVPREPPQQPPKPIESTENWWREMMKLV